MKSVKGRRSEDRFRQVGALTVVVRLCPLNTLLPMMIKLKKIVRNAFVFWLFVSGLLFCASTRADESNAPASCELQKERWSLTLLKSEDGARFQKGNFGDVEILEGEIFHLRCVDASRKVVELSSLSGWRDVRLRRDGDLLELWFADHVERGKISVGVTGILDDRGISWRVEIVNDAVDYSVVEATYPFPVVGGAPLNLFVPDRCGRAVLNAGDSEFHAVYHYPDHVASMQYFAYWGQTSGLYLGVHDPDACMKTFQVDVQKKEGRVRAAFPAINAGKMGNSFSLAGQTRWQAFEGDWFDATQIYKEFVLKDAKWLPLKGRPDTPRKFKEIAFWICDYIPNSEKQRDARPMTLATVSERFGKDYWVDAAVELKKRLGASVGYQVYNWHEIPFNINYPHFLPAREEFIQGAKRLKDAEIYVFPYINAVSWEMDDADEGFAENFANVGIHGAAINENGSPTFFPYPQLKADGEKTRLAPICPSFPRWRQIVEEVARGIEATAPVDGIYFDQVSAVAPIPCRNPEHDHAPGGGSYWSDGYNRMMQKIRAGRPDEAFYYSESNAEAYTRSFDGFLTWIWTKGDEVPAFPAIYSGYIQMLGRYTDGATRDDDVYFRYHLAEELTYGQQLGWLNACVVYNDARMAFLKKIVDARREWTDLFVDGDLKRPPVVETDLEPTTSSGIVMRQVVAGAWKTADDSKLVLFVVNISESPAKATLRLFPEEYGVDCPERLELELAPFEVRVISYPGAPATP